MPGARCLMLCHVPGAGCSTFLVPARYQCHRTPHPTPRTAHPAPRTWHLARGTAPRTWHRGTPWLVPPERLVHVTVQPALARLRGRDDRMIAGARVLAGVTVWRRVAAERRAAFLARAQMHPLRTDPGALLALPAPRQLDVGDRA